MNYCSFISFQNDEHKQCHKWKPRLAILFNKHTFFFFFCLRFDFHFLEKKINQLIQVHQESFIFVRNNVHVIRCSLTHGDGVAEILTRMFFFPNNYRLDQTQSSNKIREVIQVLVFVLNIDSQIEHSRQLKSSQQEDLASCFNEQLISCAIIDRR